MGVPFAKIEELVEAARLCEKRLPPEEQFIHVRDIGATLQKLIDDELAEMERMAKEFEEQEISAEYEMVRSKADWPHGL